ncbi:L,D-transpeptidase family protein [Thermophilibacter sp. ET337]|uniref:L,D-transpeptidase family protein n=1 Tax=Thermophilibacter sp. ET337 TaxID=2973084 RepID=UPI0021ACB099|nr:L,D-transpeptidase family protein [Thermophilibacter sp. ET337]MCR8907582.1 L,D-transpeptidase family protein [Thermophilibacter sp. ET337]
MNHLRSCRPAVVAGLVATLGLTATLAVAPVTAAADELPAAVEGIGAEAPAPVEQTADQAGALPAGQSDDEAQLLADDPGQPAQPADDAIVIGAYDEGAGKPASGGQAPTADEGAPETPETSAVPEAPADPVVDEPADGDAAADIPMAEEGEAQVPGGEQAAGETADADVTEDAETEDAAGAEQDADAEQGAEEGPIEPAASEDERDDSVAVEASQANSWVKDESGAYRWYDAAGNLSQGGWVVTDKNLDNVSGELQRYWIEADTGALAFSKLLTIIENGVTYWSYATADGYVVRGKHTVVGADGNVYVYLADNDGRLAGTGWVVSDAYGDGLQRYWVDEEAHAAVVGYSSDGWDHYTTEKGYVARGKVAATEGDRQLVYLADNDGRLAEAGWVVSDAYGDGLQRYWVDAEAHAAVVGPSADGWAHFTTPEGYVARGFVSYGDRIYVANNDGLLEDREGWLVTDAYGHGLQRYFFARDELTGCSFIQTGFFQADLLTGGAGELWFYGNPELGYVARGKMGTKNGVLIADNDGVLAESYVDFPEGMYVTDRFDGQLRRYYFVRVDGHLFAKTGVFVVDGEHYFGYEDEGYLAIGRSAYGRGMIVADNDGRLLWSDVEGWVVTDRFDGAPERYYLWDLGGGVMGARLGLFKVGANQYYGREDTGYVVRGTYTAPGGQTFYADNDGKLSYTFLTSAGWSAWERIKGLYSWTQYLIAVDVTNHRTVVFQGGYIQSKGCYGNWTPLYDWGCGTGRLYYHDGEGTPRGTYTIGGGGADYNWMPGGYVPGGYRTTYWVKNDVKYFTGFFLNLGFHSTVGIEGGYSDSSQLGVNISHGCIRLLEKNAKWIYDNALPGTKVVVY